MKIKNIAFAVLLSVAFMKTGWAESLKPSLENVFADIYADTASPYITIDTDKGKKGCHNNTYGELTPGGIRIVVKYMVERLNVFFSADGKSMPDKVVFIDVGSGAGKIPFGACIEGPFAKCVGVEYLKPRYAIAMQANEKMMLKWPSLLDGREVVFINEDALKTDMRGMLAVYTASMCFDQSMMQKLMVKLEKELPDGAIIITLKTFPITDKSRMKFISNLTLPQTWDLNGTAYAYQM